MIYPHYFSNDVNLVSVNCSFEGKGKKIWKIEWVKETRDKNNIDTSALYNYVSIKKKKGTSALSKALWLNIFNALSYPTMLEHI